MKRRFLLPALTLLTCAASAQSPNTAGTVYPDPKATYHSPHKQFAPYEMRFRLPEKISDNTPYRSAAFYGIVLRRFSSARATECDGGEWTVSIEKQRQQLQKLFPKQKVFASYQCPDMGALSYTRNGKLDNGVFIAVYAGKTEREAQKRLVQARKSAKQASISRFTASFERIMQ